jgi:energy-coupling factor transporter ATP-binding protein EcfA2
MTLSTTPGDLPVQSIGEAMSLRELALRLVPLMKEGKKVAVTGRPGVGKSYLRGLMLEVWNPADGMLRTYCTDSLISDKTPWTDIPKLVVDWGNRHPSWFLEGVAVARAIRHGLDCSHLVTLHGPDRRTIAPYETFKRRSSLGHQVYSWVVKAKTMRPDVAFIDVQVVERKFA